MPLISAAMDTVTESRLAIPVLNVVAWVTIHKNMSIKEQVNEIKKVKRFESGMVIDPVVINSDATLGDALNIMNDCGISGIPVVKPNTNKLVVTQPIEMLDLLLIKSNQFQS